MEGEDEASEDDRSFSKASIPKRIAICAAGAIVNILFAVVVYFIVMCIGIAKAMPKHEYDNIEHGSSDWCENGEEYKVLSKNKGILLAQKVFLPVNKRGNVNVLVVGRFWIW